MSDLVYYDFVYGMKSGFYKDYRFYGVLGIDVVIFGFINNDVYCCCCVVLNFFFLCKKVLEFEDIVYDKVDKFCCIFYYDKEVNKFINIDVVFWVISVDVIIDYVFGELWG